MRNQNSSLGVVHEKAEEPDVAPDVTLALPTCVSAS